MEIETYTDIPFYGVAYAAEWNDLELIQQKFLLEHFPKLEEVASRDKGGPFVAYNFGQAAIYGWDMFSKRLDKCHDCCEHLVFKHPHPAVPDTTIHVWYDKVRSSI